MLALISASLSPACRNSTPFLCFRNAATANGVFGNRYAHEEHCKINLKRQARVREIASAKEAVRVSTTGRSPRLDESPLRSAESLDDFLNAFEKYVTEEGKAIGTIRQYRSSLE